MHKLFFVFVFTLDSCFILLVIKVNLLDLNPSLPILEKKFEEQKQQAMAETPCPEVTKPEPPKGKDGKGKAHTDSTSSASSKQETVMFDSNNDRFFSPVVSPHLLRPSAARLVIRNATKQLARIVTCIFLGWRMGRHFSRVRI